MSALERPRGATQASPFGHAIVRHAAGPRLLVACATIGAALLGCEKTSSDAPAALEPCKAVGQRCEYAPGKLGACVLRDGCQGEHCFVCQSQH